MRHMFITGFSTLGFCAVLTGAAIAAPDFFLRQTLDTETVREVEELIEKQKAEAGVNDPPTWSTSADLGTFVVDDAIDIQLSANDPESDPLTYVATGLPAGLSLDSDGNLTGNAPTSVDTYDFEATADDGENTPVARTFTLVTTNIAPVWVTAADLGVYAPLVVTLTLNASDDDGHDVDYAITAGALPDGLALNTETGAVTGTPTTVEVANVTIEASDDYTGTASRAFTMEIVDGPMVFNNTGADQEITVPLNVTVLAVTMWGAGGGGAFDNAEPPTTRGGHGGYAYGVVPVTGGESLNVIVGSGGSPGIQLSNPAGAPSPAQSPAVYGGGGAGGNLNAFALSNFGVWILRGSGGGGMSALKRSADYLLVAGGGGGVGRKTSRGGSGGSTGADGTGFGNSCINASGGGGGTASNNGAAGVTTLNGVCAPVGYVAATKGSTGQGGTAAPAHHASVVNYYYTGGGGGGGWHGGGGGNGAGGGGGGSSYAAGGVSDVSLLRTDEATPPEVSDPAYETGVALGAMSGAADIEGDAGGPGLISIDF